MTGYSILHTRRPLSRLDTSPAFSADHRVPTLREDLRQLPLAPLFQMACLSPTKSPSTRHNPGFPGFLLSSHFCQSTSLQPTEISSRHLLLPFRFQWQQSRPRNLSFRRGNSILVSRSGSLVTAHLAFEAHWIWHSLTVLDNRSPRTLVRWLGPPPFTSNPYFRGRAHHTFLLLTATSHPAMKLLKYLQPPLPLEWYGSHLLNHSGFQKAHFLLFALIFLFPAIYILQARRDRLISTPTTPLT